MKKWLVVPALLVLLTAPPLFLAGTERGARLLLTPLAAVSGLAFSFRGGTVFTGLDFDRIAYHQEETQIEARDVRIALNWNLQCLLETEICLQTLELATLTVAVGDTETPTGPGEPLVLPPAPAIPLTTRIERLRIGTLLLDRGAESQQLNRVEASASIEAEHISLQELHIEHTNATLRGGLTIGLGQSWPISASLLMEFTDGSLPGTLPGNWRIRVDGALLTPELTWSSVDLTGLSGKAALAVASSNRDLTGDFELRGLGLLREVAALAPWVVLEAPVSGRFELSAAATVLSLDSQLSGWSEGPLKSTLEVRQREGIWHLVGLSMIDDTGRLRADVSGTLGRPEAWLPALEFRLADLSLPGNPDLRHLSGAGNGGLNRAGWYLADAELTLERDETPIVLRGEAREASDHALFPLGRFDATVGTTAIGYMRGGINNPAEISLPGGVVTEQLTLDSLVGRIHPDDDMRLDLDVTGDVTGHLQLRAEENTDGAAITLAPFRLQVFDQVVLSEETIEGQWLKRSAEIIVESTCLGIRTLSLCTEAATLGRSGQLVVKLDGEEAFESAIDGRPYSLTVSGNGNVDIHWSDGVLSEAVVDLQLPLVIFDPFSKEGTAEPVEWEDAKVAGTITPTAQQLSITAVSRRYGTFDARLGRSNDAITGDLKLGDIRLAAFDDLLPEIDLESGTVSGDLQIGGSVKAPELDGTLTLQQGFIRLREENIELEDLSLEVAADQDQLTLNGKAVLGEGPVTVTGSCCEDSQLQLSIVGDKNRLQLPVGLDAIVTPNLGLAVTSQHAALSGTLRVHGGTYQHSELVSNGVAVSKDVVRLDAPEAPPRRLGFSADIKTRVDPGFTLRSPQVEATLEGEVRFRSTDEEPAQLFGEMRVLGGVMRAYGQALRLEKGSVAFVGNPENPDLSLSAVRDIPSEQLRVGVRVTGTLDTPSLSLFSDPARPDRDTLSYLLRGRGPDAGAGADDTAMAMALGTSAINRSGVLDRLNAVPGLSQVSVGTEGSDEQTAATINAYVGERLFISYGMGIYEPVNVLTARLYLRSRLWVEVVSRLENSFDIYYRFDRD
ncbi:conserved hypothetical protein, putative [Luminiphilus syltensis NOR5-1B]|uniref:Translocation and assembly module TamB C-terminal domain-containing protein n=1 Tax=Luminiphilus syltensis NOR5-1B TaxID=565045 RepID=B8KVC3_9GAMM|nr:translocation/assembly module TamB domain-containing protein [Luminiphilus syltensis]EED36143.1 conserved hypothetical protein, putative [Luminiphilus syltensis NOR5-1B]